MTGTNAGDIKGNGNPSECLDIDPETLYALEACEETLASWYRNKQSWAILKNTGQICKRI